MLRLALIAALVTLLNAPWDAAARGDNFDALINLELAFRDTILDRPAPAGYQSMIRDGETTITFTRDFPDSVGKTDFFWGLDWTYDYKYATQTTDGITAVTVTPSNVKLKPRLRHVIRMPVARYQAEVWESRLLGHEFDHVAVSLDPRPRALLVHLCSQLPASKFSIASPEKPSDERMREGINREITARQSAVLDLLRANYVALDKVSQNGRIEMQDRRDFFAALYTPANLEAAKFPYLKEVAALLESEPYRQLRPRHLPADPATLPRP